MTQPIDNGPPTEREDEFWREVDAYRKTPSHYEYRNGAKIRVFDDPTDPFISPDPPETRSDDAMTWAAKVVCWCTIGVLALLLLSLLTGCMTNVDRHLWDFLD